ncbi:hypothetical protein V6N13_010969 [Hibiscus sabdariffa]|uniref:Uncharacterized protein n=1 Tax=Hibiscus sabdariffa TaxID=183260 RepID=A0ABR2SAT4_9ROSI
MGPEPAELSMRCVIDSYPEPLDVDLEWEDFHIAWLGTDDGENSLYKNYNQARFQKENHHRYTVHNSQGVKILSSLRYVVIVYHQSTSGETIDVYFSITENCLGDILTECFNLNPQLIHVLIL